MKKIMTSVRTPRVLPITILIMLLLLFVRVATFAKDANGVAHPSVPVDVKAAKPPLALTPARSSMMPTSPASLPVPQAGSGFLPKERMLLQDLRKRSKALDERERALDEQSGIVQAAERRLQQKVDQLTQLQANFDTRQKSQKDTDWNGLVKIYEDMKPTEAAAIFDVLDMRVLLGLLDRMKERKAAAVLAVMQPERARAATQMLAHIRVHQNVITSSNGQPAKFRSLREGNQS